MNVDDITYLANMVGKDVTTLVFGTIENAVERAVAAEQKRCEKLVSEQFGIIPEARAELIARIREGGA